MVAPNEFWKAATSFFPEIMPITQWKQIADSTLNNQKVTYKV